MSEETQTQTPVVTENVDKAVELFKGIYTDTTKFYTKGTALAAARARKGLSQLSKLAKVIRKELQADKKAKVAARKAAKQAVVSE